MLLQRYMHEILRFSSEIKAGITGQWKTMQGPFF